MKMNLSTQQKEEWRPIAGYEGSYEVSNLGRVRSLDRVVCGRNGIVPGKILSPRVASNGYLRVTFHHHGKDISIHRLVLSAFVGDPLPAMVANHINGNKADNRIINLEWCTQLQNSKHARVNGLVGSNRGMKWKQLSANKVREIRKKYGTVKTADLAKQFNVSQNTISRVGLGQTFKNI